MTSVWSLDDVFIGGSLMTPDMLYDTFDTEPSTDVWSFWPNGRIAEYCMFNTRSGSISAVISVIIIRILLPMLLLQICNFRNKSTLNSIRIYKLLKLLAKNLMLFVRSETLMSGVTTMSFDGEELGERSITTQDVIVSDMSVIQFDVRFVSCLFSFSFVKLLRGVLV